MMASHLMKFEQKIAENTYLVYEIPNEETNWMKEHGKQVSEQWAQAMIDKGYKLNPPIQTYYTDSTKIKLSKVFLKLNDQIDFEYDFGDSWHVLITLEKVITDDVSTIELPLLLDGFGFGIIEDVGGVYGLMDFEKAMIKKKGAKYKEYISWLQCRAEYDWIDFANFDMSIIDLEDLNFRIKKIPRVYKQIYEKKMRPSVASIKLIERHYKIKRGWYPN